MIKTIKKITDKFSSHDKKYKEEVQGEQAIGQEETVKTDFTIHPQMVEQRGGISEGDNSESLEETISRMKAAQERTAQQIKEMQEPEKSAIGEAPAKQKRSLVSSATVFDVPSPPTDDEINKTNNLPVINVQNGNEEDSGTAIEFDSEIYNRDYITKDESIFTDQPKDEFNLNEEPNRHVAIMPHATNELQKSIYAEAAGETVSTNLGDNVQAPIFMIKESEIDISQYEGMPIDDDDNETPEKLPEIQFQDDYEERMLALLAEEEEEEEEDSINPSSLYTYVRLTYRDGSQRVLRVDGAYEEVTFEFDIDIINENEAILFDTYTYSNVVIVPDQFKQIQFSDTAFKNEGKAVMTVD